MINILDLGVDAPDGSYDHGGEGGQGDDNDGLQRKLWKDGFSPTVEPPMSAQCICGRQQTLFYTKCILF